MKHASLLLCLLALCLTGCNTGTPLMDNGLEGWETIRFGGEGDVFADEDGVLNVDMGSPMSGMIYTGDVAELFGEDLENYEIAVQTQRREGIDMFMGLTFPVGHDGHVSLVIGGWTGAITGLSNLDGMNASENETTKYRSFEDNTWYDVRIRVTSEKIECWLDGEQIVDVVRSYYEDFDTHGAVLDTKPFGFFTYATWGAYRNMTVTRLD